jgi:hypothetical protein
MQERIVEATKQQRYRTCSAFIRAAIAEKLDNPKDELTALETSFCTSLEKNRPEAEPSGHRSASTFCADRRARSCCPFVFAGTAIRCPPPGVGSRARAARTIAEDDGVEHARGCAERFDGVGESCRMKTMNMNSD